MSSQEEDLSQEDPLSKRGGHSLFDHSSFPDRVILKVRDQNFTISASYLALHSAYFNKLFYGPSSTLNRRFEFDFDPIVFGDLLDFIYPCYKKTNCCADCSSSFEDRIYLALRLELKFALERLLQDNSSNDYRVYKKACVCRKYLYDWKLDPIPVSRKFLDSTVVNVRGISLLVSASTLSLHSSILREMIYKDSKLLNEVKIDVDPASFVTFLRATAGEFPSDYCIKFLDDLLFLGAKHCYEYFMSEIRMKLMALPSESISGSQLLVHFCNRPNLDMDSMKIVASYLSRRELEKVLSKCPFLNPSVDDELRSCVTTAKPMTIYAKTLEGKTINFILPRGIYTSVLEVKMRYREREGLPVDQQRLIFAGKQLEDNGTLESYKIANESTLHMVLRLRGC